MSAPSLAVSPPPAAASSPSRDEILARVREVAQAIGRDAAQRELASNIPRAEFQQIKDTRVGRLRLPRHLGGPGGSVRDVIEAIAELAAGDSSLAHALRPHFNFTETLVLGPASPEQRRRLEQVLAGIHFGGASTELGTPRPGEVTSTLTRRDGRYLLNGRKYYATGTLYADFFYTNAVDEQGENVRLLLPTNRAGVEVLDDFDGMGQRLSGSGSLRFTDAEVLEEEIHRSVPSAGPGPLARHVSTLRQLILMACQVGSIRRLEAEAIAYVKRSARPIFHSPAATAIEDPFVQREIGHIAALRQALDGLLAGAADVLDGTAAAIASRHPDVEEIVTRGTFSVVRTQIVLGPMALQAAEAIFNVGGGSATSRSRNFDRHWRNIRTILSHNPIYHKERALGDHILNGAPTPAGGAF